MTFLEVKSKVGFFLLAMILTELFQPTFSTTIWFEADAHHRGEEK